MATGNRPRNRPPHAAWGLRLLGDPALVSPEGAEQPLERRAAALFALAAIEPGITRAHAAALLWPDSDPPNARQALRQQLLRVKKHAGAELIVGHAVLRLGPHVKTDLDRDEAHGPLLGRFDYGHEEQLAHWVERQRTARRERSLRGLNEALAAAERAGDGDECVRIASRLVAVDPDNEQHHRALMRAYYLGGDVARAQGAYDRLRKMLEQEFGARPSAETEQLARTIRQAREAPARGAPPRRPPPSVLRPPRLIGRERELAALEEAWCACGGALVSGVAGMGKTRILADFAASHGEVVVIPARPGDALVSFSTFTRSLRILVARLRGALVPGVRAQLARLLPELGEAEPLRDKADLRRLLEAVDVIFGQAIEEGLAGVIVDDLHFADDASVEVLVARAVSGHRVPLIVSCREDELVRQGRAFADALLAYGGRRVPLPALDLPQVRELLESLDLPGFDVRCAADIARQAGGNPLFVLETVKAMLLEGSGAGARLPVAGTVAGLIRHRLQRLSPGARRIARCAAVAGQEFSMDLATRVLGAGVLDLADAWAELEAAQVFTDGAFAHDLIFEAALATVPAAVARRLHADVAGCLEAAGADPARIASHWEAAREGLKAAQAFTRSAAQARAVGRRLEEANLLERAAKCFADRGDQESVFEALLARAEAMVYGDLGETTLASVLAAEAAAGTDEQRLRALLCKAEFFGNRSDSLAAVETGRVGMKLAQRARRDDLRMRFALVVAGGLCELRRVEEALALLEPLRERAGSSSLAPRSRIEFLIQLGITLDLANRLSDALGAFDSARALAAAEGFKDLLATALSNLATTTSKRGHLTRAAGHGRQALQLSRESELLRGTPMQTQALLAHRLRDLGRYDESIAMLEESLEEFRRAGARHWVFSAAHRLALAYAHLGQHGRAAKLLAEEPAGLATKAQAIWMAHRAEAARLSGGDAATPIRGALGLLGADVDDGNNRLVSLLASAIVAPEEGEAMAIEVAAWAESRERFGMAVAAHARAAAGALRLGALDRAEARVDAALRLSAEFEPDNFYRGELWWIAAQVYLKAGKRPRAHLMLGEAVSWIRRVASEHVPEGYRDSFLNRNPVNREALAAAVRAGVA